ncbi:hypothetical protein DFH28DRAFT_849696, partial [Melampsora americana]
LQDAVCLINAQHNCGPAQCPIHISVRNYMEDQIIDEAQRTLVHKNQSSYIVNCSSLHFGEVHRKLGLSRTTVVTPTQRIQAVEERLAIW